MGFLFSTASVVLLFLARRTQAQCSETNPPVLQVPVYQVTMNTPRTTQYVHFPAPSSPVNNGTATTIYQISGMFASTSAATCTGTCLTQLDVLAFQNGTTNSVYTVVSGSQTTTLKSYGFTLLYSLNCVATYQACGATIPLYGYQSTQYADEYVNIGYGTDAPATDGYTPLNGGTPLCFLWVVPTTTSTTMTTTETPFTGSTTSAPSTTTASTTPYTGPTTTSASTIPYTGPSTSSASTTTYTGPTTTGPSTTSYTGPTTTGPTTTAYTGPTTTGPTTTAYTGPTTTGPTTTAYTGPTTTGPTTTPYTGPSTSTESTTPYTGPSTTAPSTLPYTGPSTTASKSTIESIGSKIGWPIWIAGVLIASLVIMAIIFGATWMFIRGGSSTNPTTNPYANQAHGYKAAHPDLPPQPVQAANTGVSTMNVGPTWTQPHSMYY